MPVAEVLDDEALLLPQAQINREMTVTTIKIKTILFDIVCAPFRANGVYHCHDTSFSFFTQYAANFKKVSIDVNAYLSSNDKDRFHALKCFFFILSFGRLYVKM